MFYRALVLGWQSILTFISMLSIYMLFAMANYNGGFDSWVGFLIFQPLFGALFSAATVAVCFLVGLPLRFNGKLRRWWLQRPIVQISLLLLGIVLLILSVVPTLKQVVVAAALEQNKSVPNLWLAGAGWGITAFALLHLYPPLGLQQWFNRLSR